MSSDSSGMNFRDMLKTWQNTREYQDLAWTGQFDDYLNMVKKNPLVTRNAFQRIYDMIMESGTTEYKDVKSRTRGKKCLLCRSWLSFFLNFLNRGDFFTNFLNFIFIFFNLCCPQVHSLRFIN